MQGKLVRGRFASRILNLIILVISILIALAYFIPSWIEDKITSESIYTIIYVLCDTMVCCSIPCIIFLFVYVFKRTSIKKHIALKRFSVFLRFIMFFVGIGLYAISYVLPYFEEIVNELPVGDISSILEMIVSLQEVYKEVGIILLVLFVIILIISRMGKHYYQYTKSMAVEYERINTSPHFTYSERNLHSKELLKAYKNLDESFKINSNSQPQPSSVNKNNQPVASYQHNNRRFYEDYSLEGSALGILAILFAIFCAPLGLLLGIIGLCIYKNSKNRKRCKIAIFIVIIITIISFVFGLSILSWILSMLETY